MYMRPNKLTIIRATVKVTIRAILKLNPRRINVTTKMAAERKQRKTFCQKLIKINNSSLKWRSITVYN